MGSLRTRYRTTIVDILDRLLDQNSIELDHARDAIAAALAADHMIYVAGSGHSHLIAEEVFYRAGGIAAAQAIPTGYQSTPNLPGLPFLTPGGSV